MARAVGGSRAVETFLRNFEGEKARYQEILEVTLCYGVQCLARTFSLKGISCNELRTITGYDAAKTRDFYVRNASQPIGREGGVMQRAAVGVRAKPSHSWRDGEEEMPDFPEPSAGNQSAPRAAIEKNAASSGASSGVLYSLPPAFDEIDFHSKLLGKPLVDLAWKEFTCREGSQIKTREELEEKLLRMDQRKSPTTIPATELPVATFAEFLGAYVAECVRQTHSTARTISGISDEEDSGQKESAYSRRSAMSDSVSSAVTGRSGRCVSTPGAAMGNTKTKQPVVAESERKQRPFHPQPQRRQPRHVPRSLQHVQSRIQPDLDARRQKILRVKKTQSQRMAETLARARLAEYDARRELQDVRDRRLGPKKLPISEITKGAAALEIVDDFMKSPLMDKFGGDNPLASASKQPRNASTSKRQDPLKEELYGTAALDNSFLGCKTAPEPRRQSKNATKQPKRRYNGWLGDFGPLHTKTVRPEWDEDNAGAEPDHRIGGTKFEWNFEHLPGGQHEPVDGREQHDTNPRTRFRRSTSYNDGGRDISDSFVDDMSDALSTNSDPAFTWLKNAV